MEKNSFFFTLAFICIFLFCNKSFALKTSNSEWKADNCLGFLASIRQIHDDPINILADDLIYFNNTNECDLSKSLTFQMHLSHVENPSENDNNKLNKRGFYCGVAGACVNTDTRSKVPDNNKNQKCVKKAEDNYYECLKKNGLIIAFGLLGLYPFGGAVIAGDLAYCTVQLNSAASAC